MPSNQASSTTELCSNNLCCEFKYVFNETASSQNRYRYALLAFYGTKTYDKDAKAGGFVCAVVACQTTELSTCGVRNESLEFHQQWQSLEIKGLFPFGNNYFDMPSTLDSSLMPFGVKEFSYDQTPLHIMNG